MRKSGMFIGYAPENPSMICTPASTRLPDQTARRPVDNGDSSSNKHDCSYSCSASVDNMVLDRPLTVLDTCVEHVLPFENQRPTKYVLSSVTLEGRKSEERERARGEKEKGESVEERWDTGEPCTCLTFSVHIFVSEKRNSPTNQA